LVLNIVELSGDGTTSMQRNPAHAFTAGGNYTVNLTAWNANGSDRRTIEDYSGFILVMLISGKCILTVNRKSELK